MIIISQPEKMLALSLYNLLCQCFYTISWV